MDLLEQELSPARTGLSLRGIEPGFFKIFHTVEAATGWPGPTSSPCIRR